MRAAGVKAGVIKLRVFRPFPAEDIVKAVKNLKALAIMDKTESFSANGGPLGAETKAAMYGKTDCLTVNYIYGIGGRDVKVDDLKSVYDKLTEMVKTGKAPESYQYLAIRE